ncbi:MAG TPA: PAS domain S-box protein, partial [Fluviicoccus sp.]|nr:PAS domain S-box protein [Fluviicoccus sp.]
MGTGNRYEQRLIAFSLWMAGLTGISGLLVLAGWIFDIQIFKTLLPGLVTMKANTAICFMMVGLAVCLHHFAPNRRLALRLCTLPVLAAGLLTLGEYLGGQSFGIDEWLFIDNSDDRVYGFPGRMAPVTAICFSVISIAILLLEKTGQTARSCVTLCAATSVTMGVVALLGYLYDVSALYTITAYASMALHTALLCVTMGLSVLCLNPQYPPVQLLTLKGPGGHITRLMLPTVVIVPALLGFLLNKAVGSQLLPGSFAVALFAVSAIFILIILVFRAASALQQTDTARDQAQQASDWQEAILNSADQIIISTDTTGTILTCNAGALKQLGYKAAEVIGKASLTAFHDPAELAVKAHALGCGPELDVLTRLARTGQADEGDWTYIRRNGTRFPVQLTITPLYNHAARLSGFLAIGRDISLRKRHESHIQEQQLTIDNVNRENQSILDNAACSIVSTDIHGVIRTFNKGAENLLGYRAEDLVGRETPAILHDPDEVAARARTLSAELKTPVEDGFEAFIAKARLLNGADEHEWTYIRKDGSRVPVLLTITAQRDASDRIIGWLGIAVDMTERKRLDRMKNEFVSTVSHELRTPLTSIRGALGLVLGKAAESLPEKTRLLLETANRNSERLAFLINDILDLEKIESGILAFSMTNRDLVAVARQALACNENYAEQHRVSLRLVEAPDCAFILGDENRLMQVFSNLLSNAVKYSPSGRTVDVAIRPNEEGFRVSVRDYGPGIPATFHSRIFQRFAQADSSDSRARGGTGLGLSITKAIIDRHNGMIDYRTWEGEGTEFYFDIPGLKADQAVITPEVLRPRMLICEDNPDLAEVMAELLDAEGIACDIVHSGQLALKQLAARRYRAIVLDLTLPDMSGLDLTRQLRDDPQLHSLPVIVVSGHISGLNPDMPADLVNVTGWLQKPLEFPRFKQALHKSLTQARRPQMLHLEDEQDIQQIVQTLVEGLADYTPVRTLADARRLLAGHHFDLLLLDLGLPDGNGLDLLKEVEDRETSVVVFSGQDV